MPPSLTGWTRLEPRPRAPSIDATLSARIRDPLWMLARQWQIGEFRGEDAGSPAWTTLAATSAAFTGWRAEGEQMVRPLDPSHPLEDLVQSEPFAPDLALRAELGQEFERLAGSQLPPKVRAALRAVYPLPPPPRAPDPPLVRLSLRFAPSLNARKLTRRLLAVLRAANLLLSAAATIRVVEPYGTWTIEDPGYDRTLVLDRTQDQKAIGVHVAPLPELEGDFDAARFRSVCAGRVPDGYVLYRAAKSKLPVLPPKTLGSKAAKNAVASALGGLVAWVEEIYGTVGAGDPPAWRPERLEYRLSALAPAPRRMWATLNVDPARTGMFDWYAFDLASVGPHGRPGPRSEIRFSVIPSHVTFRGSPHRRWWNFEAGTTAFGEVDVDKREVAKLVMLDFMLVHGNDWFMIPLEQPVGSTCRVDALVVRDVFGVETLIERADAAPRASGQLWTLFSTAIEGNRDAVADFFVLPPTAGSAALSGPAIEEVRFLRDEMANVVWGVEERIANGLGEPWPGHERAQARKAARPQRPPLTTIFDPPPPLRYLLQTPVPENWIPFPPVAVDAGRGIVRLERSYMSDEWGVVLPAGRILQPTAASSAGRYHIYEEEVPREGTRVSRHAVRTRWIDGSTHLWIARGKSVGTGEGASGLRFDVAVPVGRSPDET